MVVPGQPTLLVAPVVLSQQEGVCSSGGLVGVSVIVR